jgi:hypothetical protein
MTARLVRRNQAVQLKVRIVFASLCIGAAMMLSWLEREALTPLLGWLYLHRLVCAGIAAVASAVLVARRRALKRTEFARSWLAAVPVRPVTARWEALAIETLPASAATGGLTIMAMIGAVAVPGAPNTSLWISWLYLSAGIGIGVTLSYFIPAPKAVDLPPSSRYVPHSRAKRAAGIGSSLKALGQWPVRQMFAWIQPKMVARAAIPVLVSIPMGTTADTAMVVIAMFGVAGALLLSWSAAIAVSGRARRWLSPLPMRAGAEVRALLLPTIAVILSASLMEALLLLVLGVTYRASAAVALCTAAAGCLVTIGGVHWRARPKRTP